MRTSSGTAGTGSGTGGTGGTSSGTCEPVNLRPGSGTCELAVELALEPANWALACLVELALEPQGHPPLTCAVPILLRFGTRLASIMVGTGDDPPNGNFRIQPIVQHGDRLSECGFMCRSVKC